MKRTYVLSALIALTVSLLTLVGFNYFGQDNKTVKIEHLPSSISQGVAYGVNADGELAPLDFTEVSAKVVTAVVHIKSTQSANRRDRAGYDAPQLPDPFREFFGDRFFSPQPDQRFQPMPRVGTGSGVIINQDGYIVTNNHVIADAEDVEVTLNDNRVYKATVIGTDPTTDIALIKIDAKDITSLPFVNSDDVKVGEWVLAVGNPFSLNSTVTAGIVSAKGRNININRERFAVESFIQTDAAINPGNSGGALVNLQGGLVGINTAIASPTGAYSGYGFAVPSNLVNKVVEDLVEFGQVQRGVLGIMIRSLNGNLADQKNLDLNSGVYVDSIMENSAAGAAGIMPGDVITAIDGKRVKTSPQLQEQIARLRPGDEVLIEVNRDGEEKQFTVVLKSATGGRDLAKVESIEVKRMLGADLATLSDDLQAELDVDGGVHVKRLYPGKLRKDTNIREGFIITHVDGKKVHSVEELERILENKKGGVMLEGVYPDSKDKHYFAFGLNS